jgi:hypothetical protein
VAPGPPAPAPLTQVEPVEALRRQHQRILDRCALIDYVRRPRNGAANR